MGLMDSKRGLVVGIANDHSYAYFIAESLIRHGAECLFTHLPGEKMRRRVEKAVGELGISDPWLEPLDASSDDDLDRVFAKIGSDFGTMDFLVHSIAFADKTWLKTGSFSETPRLAFSQALDISAYTYMAMANRAAPLLPNGGSVVAVANDGPPEGGPGHNGVGGAEGDGDATGIAVRLGGGCAAPECETANSGSVDGVGAVEGREGGTQILHLGPPAGPPSGPR